METIPPLKRKPSHKTTLELKYELITPMAGGGAKPREDDEITVIRATSILGQLRFWWRACRARAFSSLNELKTAEDSIWGSMSLPSEVELWIKIDRKGNKLLGFDPKSTHTPAYAAFPLHENRGKVRSDVHFTLFISCPDRLQKEVEAALWGWTMFGGIGARTRRGFGALRLISSSSHFAWHGKNRQDSLNKLTSHWKKYIKAPQNSPPKGVPRLPSTISPIHLALGQTPGPPDKIWKGLIELYKNFRQKRPHSGRGPGRSLWPEVDAIRQLADTYSPGHPPRKLKGFPRAYYGLPIIFHFKDRRDPPDSTLEGKKYGRRSSPLLLKPLALSDGKALALGLVLGPTSLPPGGLVLKIDQNAHRVKGFEDWPRLGNQLGEAMHHGPFKPILDKISTTL